MRPHDAAIPAHADGLLLPVARMLDRLRLARDESDTAYFWELLFLGELVIKVLAVELLAGLQEDREHHRYAIEYKLVRADGIGEWAEALDALLTGPASQHLVAEARESQRDLTINVGISSDAWQRQAVLALNAACRCLDENVDDAASVKTSLRRWVRDFVWLRNRTRGHGAPKMATLSEICPVLQESINAVMINAPAFRRSWAHLKRNLSGKHRVSCFGGQRDAFEYLTREPDHALADGAYAFFDVPRPVRLLHTDPDLSDFFLPNGNYRNDTFELLSYITDERRTDATERYALPAHSQPSSETAAAPALDVVGNVFSNMPPAREGYVPRPSLESELLRVLCDDRNYVVTLQGRGGVGKTSLALNVLQQVAERDGIFAIVWFSARDIDLLPDGPRVVRADVLTTDDVARDFAELMRPGESLKLAEIQQYLTDCLSGQANDGPFIFVFDNFETIREQSALFAYLSNAVRLPNKVLVTTRTRDFKADYPIEVRGMARDEYHLLVSEVAARLEIEDLVTGDYEDQLYEESDGHPYITKVLLGDAARSGRRVSLKTVVAAKDAMLDALFDRSFASLSPAAQRVFLTLCSWRSLVPRVGLAAVLLRPGNERLDVDRAVDELQQSSLVEETLDPETDAAFLSVPLAAAMFGKRRLVTSPMKIAIEADLELVHDFGATTMTDLSHGIGLRIDRLTRAAAKRAEAGETPPQLSVIEYIATEYPPAWLNLAELHQELGDSAAAIGAVSRYLESSPADQAGWQRLIGLYRSCGDALGEMHARLQLAELARPSFRDLTSSASRLNGLLARREIALDADERRLMIRRLRSLIEDRVDEADATDLSRLAWLCINDDQDSAAAAKWAKVGLEREPENQHCAQLLRKIGAS